MVVEEVQDFRNYVRQPLLDQQHEEEAEAQQQQSMQNLNSNNNNNNSSSNNNNNSNIGISADNLPAHKSLSNENNNSEKFHQDYNNVISEFLDLEKELEFGLDGNNFEQ
ncbi:hypothetical protein ACO0SA_003247 [Hanseniaspora valbyensis]